MTAAVGEAKLERGAPRERDHRDAGQGEQDPHASVGHVVGVCRAGRVVERAVEASQGAREADEHLAERRMHVKVELAGQRDCENSSALFG